MNIICIGNQIQFILLIHCSKCMHFHCTLPTVSLYVKFSLLSLIPHSNVMFLWWLAPLLLLHLTDSTTVTLYQISSSSVTVHVTTNNHTLPTLLPTDVTLVFSPSLTLSDYNVFIPAKLNTSMTPPGTVILSLPRNLDLSKGVFYLFDRVIPHKLDRTIVELAVDSLFFSTAPVSVTDQQVTVLKYAIDDVMVLRR